MSEHRSCNAHKVWQTVISMAKSDYEEHDELTEKTLKPVTKVKSKLDKELQEWEVESTKDGQDSQGQ